LAAEPDAVGLLKVVLFLSMIWWIYDGYVWLTNALPLDALRHRLLLIGGMSGFLIIALAIPTAFEGSGVAFGLGYLAVVGVHGALYMYETSASDAAAIRGIVPYNVAAALLLTVGGAVGEETQWVLYAGVGVLVWFIPVLVSMEGFQIAAPHFVERHGLVVIVALGESIVVLGAGAAGAEVGLELALIALLGLALSAVLWWTYFGEEEAIEEAMRSAPAEERPRLALLFGYAVAFLLFGVVLVATGLKKAIPDPLETLSGATAVALAGGAALFVAADAAMLRWFRIAQSPPRAAAVVGILATIPLGVWVSAALEVAAIAAIIAAALIVDNATRRTWRNTSS
jgi:low temperature requirement protein LtrA